MTRVGLIGPADREEFARLSLRLEERGGEGVVLDTRSDPAIQMGPEGEFACGVELRRLSSFYVADLGLRCAPVEREDGSLDRAASEDALASSRRRLAAWNALLARLASRCRVVNPPETHDLHGLKPWEMATYEQNDLPIPLTVSSSDPAALLEARDQHDGAWIRKGMVGGYGYTESFTPPASLTEARSQLERGPLMVQERIEGDNIRAFVLGGRVIGSGTIISREGEETDSRRGLKRVTRIELPADVAANAVRAAGLWNLAFAAVDLMHDAGAGRYVILECNSAPFFVNFERLSGLDVASPLADYLMDRARTIAPV